MHFLCGACDDGGGGFPFDGNYDQLADDFLRNRRTRVFDLLARFIRMGIGKFSAFEFVAFIIAALPQNNIIVAEVENVAIVRLLAINRKRVADLHALLCAEVNIDHIARANGFVFVAL